MGHLGSALWKRPLTTKASSEESRHYCRDQGLTGMFNHPGESTRSWTASAQARVCTGKLLASIGAAKEEVGSLKCVPGGSGGRACFSSTSKGSISNLWLMLSSRSQGLCCQVVTMECVCC